MVASNVKRRWEPSHCWPRPKFFIDPSYLADQTCIWQGLVSTCWLNIFRLCCFSLLTWNIFCYVWFHLADLTCFRQCLVILLIWPLYALLRYVLTKYIIQWSKNVSWTKNIYTWTYLRNLCVKWNKRTFKLYISMSSMQLRRMIYSCAHVASSWQHINNCIF